MKRKQFISSIVPLAATLSAFAHGKTNLNIQNPTAIPPYLKPGDMVGICCPAGYITEAEIKPALLKLNEWGFTTRVGSTVGKKDFTYGGTDDERLQDLQQMLDDKNIKAILFARGGYGAVRIIDRVDFKKFKRNPKWVIGFSDATVFHSHINENYRVATIHSKMCNSFPDDWSKAEAMQKDFDKIISYVIDADEPKKALVKGIAVGDKIGAGNVSILFSLDKRVTEGHEFKHGDVLVTDMTDPDWEPIMKKASAIITNKGGRTCHAAIVARELGVPAIVGCNNATEILSTGQFVTASCAEGGEGVVYEGQVQFEKVETDLSHLPHVKTPIMLNVASPDMAFKFSHLPNSGVGLAREEFIINNFIQVHPLALMQHNKLGDVELTASIKKMIRGCENEEDYFIQKLSYGVAKIAAAFYPNKVIVRFSDFKSNEYYNLLGGKHFEPHEENPMIGWRGASRYYSDTYKAAFGLECKAIKKVREDMGLDNVVVMIPFCRTVDELHKVHDVMKAYGLERGKAGLELFLMAEIPSNIILAEEFAKYIDGFSIGSNDLTQLTMGLDRDSSLVAHLYDERNPAVKQMLRLLIDTAKRMKVKVGICGQGPSDFPDFAQFLVELGIDSISVTPDSVVKTVKAIAEVEKKIGK